MVSHVLTRCAYCHDSLFKNNKYICPHNQNSVLYVARYQFCDCVDTGHGTGSIYQLVNNCPDEKHSQSTGRSVNSIENIRIVRVNIMEDCRRRHTVRYAGPCNVYVLTRPAILRFGQSVDRLINRALLTVRSADTPMVHRRCILAPGSARKCCMHLLCSMVDNCRRTPANSPPHDHELLHGISLPRAFA